MKTILVLIGFIILTSFTRKESTDSRELIIIEVPISSFSLVNDSKEKVSIHTGRGFVTLNKGGKTSITCNTGREVRWANNGRKGDLIFKIAKNMCGKTVKLSKFL